MKIALVSVDYEDWYHLDYINPKEINFSMLDGLDYILDLLSKRNIPLTIFTLVDIINELRRTLNNYSNYNPEIALHGYDHSLPLKQDISVFKESISKSLNVLSNKFQINVSGYRAPCFSFNRELLDIIIDAGFSYDSSRINFSPHPLYGNITLEKFNSINPFIHKFNNFIEFELPTYKILGKNIPISGGGYLRILPWCVLKKMVEKFISKNSVFPIYLHPFEFSLKNPGIINEISFINKIRFNYNLTTSREKLVKLIDLLEFNGFSFMNFKQAHSYYAR